MDSSRIEPACTKWQSAELVFQHDDMVVIDAALLVPQEIEALGAMQLIKTL
jgi:hypothetical protein